jgi:crotonobetainyl-CoA:carnitine CoA-transferase CaiB-like acyl-CoA transferase
MAGPLKNIKVLELSRVLAGPWAGQILADLGAEVIKVERPEVGDETRAWGPPFLKNDQGEETKESAYFLSTNRGKKSITVDFTKPEGQEIIRKLIKQCDVLIENFKVGGLKKYDLDYESVRAINPKIIYCSITGFGQTGPYAHRAGYDFMIQGLGGLMSVTGESDHLPGGGPQKVGVALVDVLTGLYATIGIQGALFSRTITGQGQHIDMSLLDVQAASLANQASNYLIGGQLPQRLGNAHPNIVPYQVFATSNGYIILAVGNDNQFKKFCDVARVRELATDKRFALNQGRVQNRETLIDLIKPVLKEKTSELWLEVLEKSGVPCGPINDISQVFDDPQIQSRNTKIIMDHALAEGIPLVANPIRYSETDIEYKTPPPTLGQHSNEILTEMIAYSQEEIEVLKKKKVI